MWVIIITFATPSIGLTVENKDIERYLGEYQGISVSDPDGLLSARDLDVTVHTHDNGFVMEWVTITPTVNDQLKRQEYKVKFHPTQRESIYSAAMRPDLFGGWVPLDPFEGDPFMWARILDSTLTIYAMFITDTGAHDMQIYERTLTKDGLNLNFQRLRDDTSLGVVKGVLKRIR